MSSKNWRANTVFFLIILCGAGIVWRLFYLQVIKGEAYKTRAQDQQSTLLEIKPKRGDIYFKQEAGKDGEKIVAATTSQEPFLRVCNKDIEDNKKASQAIAQITGQKEDEILKIIETGSSYYKTVKSNLSKDEVDKIKALDMFGVEVAWQDKRIYPNGTIASQIIGFLNRDGKGQYGVEEYFNDILAGEGKVEEGKITPWGFLFSGASESPDEETSVYLTIDPNIQFQAEKILQAGLEKYGSESGEILVAEPSTGNIVAMAQYPNFDSNKFSESSMENFSNKCTQVAFEPGSIFKPVTIATGLNEGKISPETKFNDEGGYRLVSGYRVWNYNHKAWGERTMTESLQYSINVGVMDAESLIGNQLFYNSLRKFGFMEKTGIELAGEVTSQNNQLKTSLENNIQVNFANASFGQGVEMTPLQIVRAFCGLANKGQMPERMSIVEKEIVKGKEKALSKQTYRTVISQEAASKLVPMLVNVVENGYGHLAKIPGYYIAGKTGTAQVPYSVLGENRSGYSDHTWQTFMGFAPAYNPRFVILVKLDNPTKAKTSEYSSAPMFHDLAEYILRHWQIAPDYDPDLNPATSTVKK
ncbi:MAG: penicillin-binding protein 2 [Candidatus Paceibacterota bacterium]